MRMCKITITRRISDDADLSEDVADELERIAELARDGFTSGEVIGGWWKITEDAEKEVNIGERWTPKT